MLPLVLPMYMGVILPTLDQFSILISAPHVYGGDPDSLSVFRS